MTTPMESTVRGARQPLPRRFASVVLVFICAVTATQCAKGEAATETEARPTTTAGQATTTQQTTEAHDKVAPLTGLSATPAVRRHCAVSVKIGNTADARPQYGVGAADVVYEIVVDGGITRLMAVFQSHSPGKVGTIRSVRPTDHTLVQPLRGIFAYSGGNRAELDSIDGAPVLQLDEVRAGSMMARDPNGQAPNNLYARVDRMHKECPDGPPQPLFRFRKANTKASGAPVKSATVHYKSPYDVSWTWSAKSAKWFRTRLGGPDRMADNKRIAAANVVVMSISYTPGPDIPDARGVIEGSGPLAVFSAGKVTHGTWSRPDQNRPPKLLDKAGHEITLTPGKTWVELPDRSYPVTAR